MNKDDASEHARQSTDPVLAAILDSATDYAFITTDMHGVITSWNVGAQRLLGWQEDEIVGESGFKIFTPEDRERGAPQAEIDTALAEGRAEDERWHVRKDGSRFWGSGLLVPLRGAAAPGFLKIMRDRTEKRQAERALKESEQRFRMLAEHIPQLVWRSRSLGEWTWGSPQWEAYSGLSLEKSVGLGWLDAVHPQDRHATLEAWREAERKGELYIEHRIRRASEGEYRWFQTRASPLVDDDRRAEWFGTSTDVNELRRLQDQQAVLLREVHHRTRNLLGIVSSIARRTLARSGSLEAFKERFEHRLAALARVQGLVAQDCRVADFGELVRLEIAAHGLDVDGERVRIEGPPVTVAEKAMETLALAIHELATNATKHGAFSSEGGRLRIRWWVRPDQWLVLEWLETGLTAHPTTAQRGYGRELIEVALPYALGAQTSYELGPDRLVCVIELPDFRAGT
jgi:PAS domain S-box-containing protein